MTNLFASIALAAGLIVSSAAFAQAPAGAPAGSTGVCKDGSFTSNATKAGACSGHKGVKDWFGQAAAPVAAKAAPAVAAAAVVAAPAPAVAAPTAAPVAPAVAPAKPVVAAPAAKAPAAVSAPAAGGGAGKVWVNADSKVYHCPGTKYYGKTKQGEYMTEAAAKAAGMRANHGKACTS